MEQQSRVASVLEEDLARHLRIAQFGITLDVGIERAADTTTAAAAGDGDAVDIEEMRVALAKPVEVFAVVERFRPETHKEARQRAIALGDPEVFGFRKRRSLAASSGRMAGPAALLRARTESSSCSRTSRMTIDIPGSRRLVSGMNPTMRCRGGAA